MPRVSVLFAIASITFLVLGGFALRFDLRAHLSLALPRAHYVVPNSTLCFGVALFFCLFAFLYSLWFVPWSVQAAGWHFAFSLIFVALFVVALLDAGPGRLTAEPAAFAVSVLLAFNISPVLFLLIQGVFLLDGIRRCWPLFRG
jgi:hypothetical protein